MKKLWKYKVIFLIFVVLGLKAQELPDREIHYRPGDWISYPVTRFITSIALGHQYTYFGTTGGITRYDFYRNRWDSPFTVSDGLEDDRIRVVAFDFTTGYLWCATDAGLSYRVASSEEWWNISYRSLGFDDVTAIGSGKNYLWLESSKMLFKGDRKGGPFWTASPDEEISDEVQWSRRENGLNNTDYFFMEGGYSFFPEGFIQDVHLRQFNITHTLQDKFEHLWMATWGLGGGMADMKTSYLELIPFGPYTSEMDAMAWDDEGMWIGGRHSPGEQGGITWWNMERGEWTYFEANLISSFRSDMITAIVPDDRYVWFGTLEGLVRYDKERDTWKNYSIHDNLWDDRVYSLALGDGVLWVGTESGINRILLPGVAVEQIRDKRLIHRRIHHLEADGEDVWAGTNWGIFHYVGQTGEWQTVSGYEGMLDQEVTAISVWEGEVWFGTDDGIEMYDKKTKRWQGFPEAHYPTGGRINNILADKDVVWVGTENGILKYLKEENRWRRFSTEDGLLDNSVRWILPDGDYVWLGTGRGLTRFYWNAPYRVD